jgi:hypothetical protein
LVYDKTVQYTQNKQCVLIYIYYINIIKLCQSLKFSKTITTDDKKNNLFKSQYLLWNKGHNCILRSLLVAGTRVFFNLLIETILFTQKTSKIAQP